MVNIEPWCIVKGKIDGRRLVFSKDLDGELEEYFEEMEEEKE